VHDLDQLHRLFLDDQVAAPREEAAEMFRLAAGARGVDYGARPSAWVLALLRDARRHLCPHAPREGSVLVFVPAHVRQVMCRACAHAAAKAMRGRPDETRCDVCRQVATLERFMFHAGSTLLVTGRHCPGCRATVYGQAA
jgi:hypothetical protein